jgi:uncharacterized membrane protein YdjX (TVP38/TMEM64 family)
MAEALQNRAGENLVQTALLFVAIHVFFTTFLIPVWPLPFLAGAVFGVLKGTVVASTGCVTAAAATFLLARAIGRTALRGFLERAPRLRAVEKTVGEAGWKVVAAVRVSHFLTFGMQNYALGLTRIGLGTFMLATWGATLPGIALQAYVGHLGFTSVEAWQQTSPAAWRWWAFRAGGLLVLAAAVAYLARLSRSLYRDSLKAQLEVQLEREQASQPDRKPFMATRLLWLLACVSLLVAVGSVLARDSLRQFVEQWLTRL